VKPGVVQKEIAWAPNRLFKRLPVPISTCPGCGHPLVIKMMCEALEEMGIACQLSPLFSIRYRADLDHGMIEHELVHVFGGRYNGEVLPDPAEADGFAWLTLQELASDVDRAPECYSVWFRIYLRDHGSALIAKT